jgi:hypothetical protein
MKELPREERGPLRIKEEPRYVRGQERQELCQNEDNLKFLALMQHNPNPKYLSRRGKVRQLPADSLCPGGLIYQHQRQPR